MMTAAPDNTAQPDGPVRRNPVVMGLILVAVAFILFMWIYAFFFASESGINRVEDRAWSQRAEATCASAKTELLALADYRRLDDVGEGALLQRAEIVTRANAVLTTMVDTLAAELPTDEQGLTVIPRWLDDYRQYLADRDAYVVQLRSGSNRPFAETEVNGSPISNFIGDVARQNEMASCQVPLDLAN